MEKIIKKLFFATSALVAVSLALAPVTAYLSSENAHAVECRAVNDEKKTCQDNSNTTLSVEIISNLTLDTVTPPAVLNVAPGTDDKTGTFTAQVSANQAYVIQLSAEEPNLTTADKSANIPAKAGFSTTVSGWAIQDQTDSNNWKAVTKGAQTFFKGSANTGADIAAKTTTFTFGVGASQSQTPGTYTTNVTVTAAPDTSN